MQLQVLELLLPRLQQRKLCFSIPLLLFYLVSSFICFVLLILFINTLQHSNISFSFQGNGNSRCVEDSAIYTYYSNSFFEIIFYLHLFILFFSILFSLCLSKRPHRKFELLMNVFIVNFLSKNIILLQVPLIHNNNNNCYYFCSFFVFPIHVSFHTKVLLLLLLQQFLQFLQRYVESVYVFKTTDIQVLYVPFLSCTVSSYYSFNSDLIFRSFVYS